MAAVLALAAAADAAADSGLDGLTIRHVTVEGAATLSEETVLFYLGLAAGETYDPAALDLRLQELWQRGLIDDVSVEATPSEDGVGLAVRLVERPTIASVEYSGARRVPASALAARVAEQGIRVGAGEALDRGELRRLELSVGELYRERGFALAAARVEVAPAGPGEVSVEIHVDEGERVRIAEIGFDGNAVFSDARLRRAMQESGERGWISRLRKTDRYDPAALARDLERVGDLYRRAGYKDATLGEPVLGVEGGGSAGRRLRITVPVEEGGRWRLGGISFTGNRRFSDERLLRQFERPPSGWLGSRFVEEGVERVRDLYSRNGHLQAVVETGFVERAGRTADLVVSVVEGEQYRVGRIEIEGNSVTRDKVIRRELAVHEGEVLNASALRRSLLRLHQLDYFAVDESEPVRFALDAEAGRVDLVLRGQEADQTHLFFGGGYGGEIGLFGQLQYTSRNFRGRGESVEANLQLGSGVTVVEAGYTLPWLFDRPQSLGVELFTRDQEVEIGGGESALGEASGGRLTYGRRLGLFQSISWSLSHSDLVDRRRRLDALGGVVEDSLSRRLNALRLAYTLDRIDHRFHPTRGVRFQGSLETAGGLLGGDADTVRAAAAVSLFRPLRGSRPRSVFGFNLQAGAVAPLAGGVLTFGDRFQLGGESSLRGHRSRSVRARGSGGEELFDAAGFPLGGDRFLEASLEYHLLVNEVVRLVLFADSGAVWAEGQPFDLSGLRQTAGLELRVAVPMLPQPLRFIWAESLDPLEGDQFRNFRFAFGASF